MYCCRPILAFCCSCCRYADGLSGRTPWYLVIHTSTVLDTYLLPFDRVIYTVLDATFKAYLLAPRWLFRFFSSVSLSILHLRTVTTCSIPASWYPLVQLYPLCSDVGINVTLIIWFCEPWVKTKTKLNIKHKTQNTWSSPYLLSTYIYISPYTF